MRNNSQNRTLLRRLAPGVVRLLVANLITHRNIWAGLLRTLPADQSMFPWQRRRRRPVIGRAARSRWKEKKSSSQCIVGYDWLSRNNYLPDYRHFYDFPGCFFPGQTLRTLLAWRMRMRAVSEKNLQVFQTPYHLVLLAYWQKNQIARDWTISVNLVSAKIALRARTYLHHINFKYLKKHKDNWYL